MFRVFPCFPKSVYFIFNYLSKWLKNGWFNRLPPWSFTNLMWRSDNCAFIYYNFHRKCLLSSMVAICIVYAY